MAAQRAGVSALVVDDSIMMRSLLRRALLAGGVNVLDVAATGQEALQKIDRLNPDVVVLDLEMPGLAGLGVLEAIMHARPRPVIMTADLTPADVQDALICLEKGALNLVPKPLAQKPGAVQDFLSDLVQKVRIAAGSNVRRVVRQQMRPGAAPPVRLAADGNGRLVAIGAGTGGPAALVKVLPSLPRDCPPAVIALHVPRLLSGALARQLDGMCSLRVREAADGELLERGTALLAPGGCHLRVRRESGRWIVRLDKAPKVCGSRPSADVLLTSVVEAAGAGAVGVVLSGVGCDGSEGVRAIRAGGGASLVQDPAGSLIAGMPDSAVATGCVDRVAGLAEMASVLVEMLSAPMPASA